MKVELGKFLEVMGIPYKDIHLFKEAFTHTLILITISIESPLTAFSIKKKKKKRYPLLR